eukprot:3723203-Alexandrium_andersonii.AAC.1
MLHTDPIVIASGGAVRRDLSVESWSQLACLHYSLPRSRARRLSDSGAGVKRLSGRLLPRFSDVRIQFRQPCP